MRAEDENESFELALATLKFVPAVNTVVVVLPAPQGAPADHVMVVRRDDATTALTHPLKDALGWKTTPAADAVPTSLVAKIDHNAAPHIFRFEVGRDAGGRVAMALFSRQ